MNTWKLNNSPEQPMDEKKNYNGKLKVPWDKKNGGGKKLTWCNKLVLKEKFIAINTYRNENEN